MQDAPQLAALSTVALVASTLVQDKLSVTDRLRACCASKAWAAAFGAPSAWSVLDLSATSCSSRLLTVCAAKARGGLVELRLNSVCTCHDNPSNIHAMSRACECDKWRRGGVGLWADPPQTAQPCFVAVLEAVASAEQLRRLSFSDDATCLRLEDVVELLYAAPALTSFRVGHLRFDPHERTPPGDMRRICTQRELHAALCCAPPFEPVIATGFSASHMLDINESFCDALVKHPSLASLGFETGPNLADLADPLLVATMSRLPALVSFEVTGTGLGSDAVVTLLVACPRLRSLTVDGAGNNHFHFLLPIDANPAVAASAAARVAGALRVTLLTSQYLTHCDFFEAPSCVAVLAALTGHASLHTLVLDHNELDVGFFDAGLETHANRVGEALGELVAFDSRRLCFLSLEECRLGPRLTPLLNALTQNFCLSALHVRDNTLNAAAARALLDALTTAVEEYNNTAMRSLLVSGSIYGTTEDDDAHLDDDEYLAEQIVEAYLKTAERLVKRNAQMPVPTIPGDEYEEESDDEEVHE